MLGGVLLIVNFTQVTNLYKMVVLINFDWKLVTGNKKASFNYLMKDQHYSAVNPST